ncbi:hypothetical protein J6590_102153 [Homalodisca vitripennis]|nr:hypothetical protein J6590_102153 [Homalodisca vitripennis]
MRNLESMEKLDRKKNVLRYSSNIQAGTGYLSHTDTDSQTKPKNVVTKLTSLTYDLTTQMTDESGTEGADSQPRASPLNSL